MYPEVISKIGSLEEAFIREQVQEAPGGPGVNPLGAGVWDELEGPER